VIRYLSAIARTPVTRRHVVALLLLTALAGASVYFLQTPAPPPAPPAPPAPPPVPVPLAVWEQAGFQRASPMWGDSSDLPHLVPSRALTDDALTKLPEIDVPFSLDLSNTQVSDEGLKHLGRLKKLTT
jgi:hypothetical protein